jgi:Zn finger protein HypA/HybF involved in hydrogenase expression
VKPRKGRRHIGGIDIIGLAFSLAEAVRAFADHAKRFCYEVMVSGYACTKCGGPLTMIAESRCRCRHCKYEFDPTIAFQRCSGCGGRLRLRISRYQCRACKRDVPSRFTFDGPVFDQEYFRQRMAESRQRKAERREKVQKRLLDSRSPSLDTPAAELDAVPGLLAALNDLVGTGDVAAWLPLCKGFDLNRYQKHLQACVRRRPVDFDDIPPIEDNPRLDRIWRFVVVVFMAHGGLIEIEQDGHTIMLRRKDETDNEG